MMSDVIVGIDLGTTNSLVGLIDTGFPVLIPMDEGKRLLPSCLHFPSADAEPMIGYAAKRARAGRPSETIYSVKRFVGRRHAELDEEDMVVTYPIEKDENGEIVIPIHGRTYNAVELSSLILKKLKAAAEKYLEAPVTKAVITVPAYFNDAQRAATKKAGELAGFQVERILNEPTAAAMAFGIDKKLKDARCAVYDLGGGTFDLSILELNEGVSRVLSTNGNTRLGGDDIDAVLTDEIARRLVTAARCHIDRALLARIHEIAEKVKCELSDAETSKVEIPFAKDDFHFETTITREELEFLAKPIIEKTRKHCMQALADAKLSPEEIDEVILVGGQTRMPLVREVVREIFKREPNTSVNPDEAVALGAAIQGGILSGAVQNMILLDVTPLSLGIETFGGLMNVIIGRNTTIPVKAGEQFTNAVANQSSMRIHILQGERELSRDNWSLGQFDLEFTPSPRGVARVGVQFEIDADGILNVLARDIATGAEKRVAIRSAVDVSDEQVEKMVAESVEFAFDDMRERQFIEAELKARRLMETTSKAVAMMAGKLSDDEERQVAELIEGIKISCESRDPLQVKVAMQNLDKGTAFLAQLLMDSAVDDALAKKMIST